MEIVTLLFRRDVSCGESKNLKECPAPPYIQSQCINTDTRPELYITGLAETGERSKAERETEGEIDKVRYTLLWRHH